MILEKVEEWWLGKEQAAKLFHCVKGSTIITDRKRVALWSLKIRNQRKDFYIS